MGHLPREIAEEMTDDIFSIVSQLRTDPSEALKSKVVQEAANLLFGDLDDYSYIPNIFISITRRGSSDEMELIEPLVQDAEWEDFSKDDMIGMIQHIVSNTRPDWLLHIFECYSVAGDTKTAAAATSWMQMGQPLRLFPGATEELRAHLTGGETGDINLCLSQTIHKDGTLGEINKIEIDGSAGRFSRVTDAMKQEYPGAIDE